jgi:hypothetical protein
MTWLMLYGGSERLRLVRAAVNPLRCAIHASRKPGVTILGHPFDACVSPLEAAGKTFCAFALHAARRKPVVRKSRRTPLVACDEPVFFTPRPKPTCSRPTNTMSAFTGGHGAHVIESGAFARAASKFGKVENRRPGGRRI